MTKLRVTLPQRYNLEAFKEELRQLDPTAKVIALEGDYTMTLKDNAGTQYYPPELIVEADISKLNQFQTIADAHTPEKTEAEAEEEDRMARFFDSAIGRKLISEIDKLKQRIVKLEDK